MDRKEILENMRAAIDCIIEENNPNEAKLPGVYPNDVVSYIKERYGVEKDNWDTNGWQYDYWIYFIIDGTKFCLSGSGYYGRLTFGIEVDY